MNYYKILFENLIAKIQTSQNCVIYAGLNLDGEDTNSIKPSFVYRAINSLAEFGIVKQVINVNSNGMFLRAGMKHDYITNLYGDEYLTQCPGCLTEYTNPDPNLNSNSNSNSNSISRNKFFPVKSEHVCTLCSRQTQFSKLNEGSPISNFALDFADKFNDTYDLAIVLGDPIILDRKFYLLMGREREKTIIVVNENVELTNEYANMTFPRSSEYFLKKVCEKFNITVPEYSVFKDLTLQKNSWCRTMQFYHETILLRNNYYARALLNYKFNKIDNSNPERMTERSFDSKIDRLIVELKKKNCVVLCGAGISCAAGIPDFRGTNGLVTKKISGQPVDIDSIPPFDQIIPTYAHRAIAKLMELDYVSNIISLNVDGLFLRSNVNQNKLYNVHGNCYIYNCKCNKTFIGSQPSATIFQKPTGFFCPSCQSVLNDSILNWQENLPSNFKLIKNLINEAKLVLCIGNSFQQDHIYKLVLGVNNARTKVININLIKTRLDKKNWVTSIFEDCHTVMERVIKGLSLQIDDYNPNQDPTQSGSQFVEAQIYTPKESLKRKKNN